MKLFLPKQHGAWAMLIFPFWLGVVASSFVWVHIPFFLGWLFLYLGTYPLLLLFKKNKNRAKYYQKWAIIYLSLALLLLLIPLWYRPTIIYFGLSMIPFFLINIYYSKQNDDRAFFNDLSAIISFCIAGLASSFLANGQITSAAITVFITTILFFIGSTFFVKTMIREKHNPRFKWISWIYHILLLLLCLLTGNWLIAIAYIPSVYRAIAYYGKSLAIKQIGIRETVNAILFFVVMLFAL